MSKQTSQQIYLGYEDEQILDKYKNDVSYITNKIGGIPDWPPLKDLNFSSQCPLCGITRPLILQCYAPIQHSPYHRTLYVFGCINPICWNKSESWCCIRSQILDKTYVASQDAISSCNNKKTEVDSAAWCMGADEWDEKDDGDENFSGDGSKSLPLVYTPDKQISDDDDDDNIMDTLEVNIENMKISNTSVPRSLLVSASAEIENDDSVDITIDTPVFPKNNIAALFTEVPELPSELFTGGQGSIEFEAKFITVAEEYLSEESKSPVSDHIKKLINEYEKENKKDTKSSSSKGKGSKEDVEEYEKAIPLHGNELFHSFLMRIQMNPLQILRYSWGGQPLIMSPLPTSIKTSKCKNCKGSVWFELQILPTMIPSLHLTGSHSTHLEFGTVLIYSCKKSCWKEGGIMVAETVIVQSEPL